MTDETDSRIQPDQPDDPYRKLMRSMIRVIILLACAALLLALGQCARQRRDAAPELKPTSCVYESVNWCLPGSS